MSASQHPPGSCCLAHWAPTTVRTIRGDGSVSRRSAVPDARIARTRAAPSQARGWARVHVGTWVRAGLATGGCELHRFPPNHPRGHLSPSIDPELLPDGLEV